MEKLKIWINKVASELKTRLKPLLEKPFMARINGELKKFSAFISKHGHVVVVVSIAVALIVTVLIIHYFTRKSISPSPQAVTVAKVISETVPHYYEYVGTTASIQPVDIRARVKGFLVERAFKEGDDVKEGDLMFVIDPREYEANLEKAKAQLTKSLASLELANQEVERYIILVEKDYVTKEFFDQKVTAAKEAEAAVTSSKAALATAELELSYCRMYSPVNGRVGRTMVHVGNLVGAGMDTLLATIVPLDPIYIYFSPSENEVHKILEYKNMGTLTVELSFSDGDKYKYKGTVDFVDNAVDPTTSTVKMRALIPNPDKTLLPGVYANVHLLVTEEPNTLLVPSEAIAEDQGGSYVFTVNKDNIVELRHIKAGPTYKNMRVAEKGLERGELVVVEGQQLVRPGSSVTPEIREEKQAEEKNEEKIN